jgi:hypothetical protein
MVTFKSFRGDVDLQYVVFEITLLAQLFEHASVIRRHILRKERRR